MFYFSPILVPCFEWNSYAVHPEALLLAMLGDSDPVKRLWAAKKIIQLRELENKNAAKEVRIYVKPQLKFNALSYDQMINWDTENITEPRLTMLDDNGGCSNEDLLDIASGVKKLTDFIPNIPCHRTASIFYIDQS